MPPKEELLESALPVVSPFEEFRYVEPLRTARCAPATPSAVSPTSRKRFAGVIIPSSPSPKRSKSSYAPPSTYAHLPQNPAVDALAPNLIAVSIGLNPGLTTAATAHAYAHHSNLYYKLLYAVGITDKLCPPTEDKSFPARFQFGHTNLLRRPTRNQAELSWREMVDATPDLESRITQYRPEAVCIVGKGIWEAIFAYKHGRKPKKTEFAYGWQDENLGASEGWNGARVFVASSTSGLAANTTPKEKEAIWKPFGEWVQRRRAERANTDTVICETIQDTVTIEAIPDDEHQDAQPVLPETIKLETETVTTICTLPVKDEDTSVRMLKTEQIIESAHHVHAIKTEM